MDWVAIIALAAAYIGTGILVVSAFYRQLPQGDVDDIKKVTGMLVAIWPVVSIVVVLMCVNTLLVKLTTKISGKKD